MRVSLTVALQVGALLTLQAAHASLLAPVAAASAGTSASGSGGDTTGSGVSGSGASAGRRGGQWVAPRGLPPGHNGGVKERLLEQGPMAGRGKQPHVLFVLFDVSRRRGPPPAMPQCPSLSR